MRKASSIDFYTKRDVSNFTGAKQSDLAKAENSLCQVLWLLLGQCSVYAAASLHLTYGVYGH